MNGKPLETVEADATEEDEGESESDVKEDGAFDGIPAAPIVASSLHS